MRSLHNRGWVALFILGSLIAGCTTSSVREQAVSPVLPEQAPELASLQQIAADFTGMLVQVKELSPAETTLLWSDVTHSAGPFAAVLKSELLVAGYDLISSDDRDHQHAVGFFKVEDAHSADGVSGTYIVSVGDTQIQRSYRILSDGVLVANSEMSLRGTDASGIRRHSTSMPTVIASQLDTGLRQPESKAVEIDDQIQYAGIVNLVADSTGTEPFTNLFNVYEAILSFGRESESLSSQSRALLQIVVSKFDPQTDLIVVAGCAQAEIQRKGGNAELAVARVKNASKALESAGVPERNIFEAGCWADEVIDLRYPTQGLVATLKREATS